MYGSRLPEWEAADAEETGLICPGCLTLGEELAIEADMEQIAVQAADVESREREMD